MKTLCFALLLAAPLAASAADLAHGERLFNARCSSCHAVGPGAHAGFGPQLTGIVGRRAASTQDFAYSPAMKKSNIVWTEQRLSAFIDSPDKVVPGNKMRFWGISDKQQVGDLIAYLRSVPTSAPVAAPAFTRGAAVRATAATAAAPAATAAAPSRR